jgi:formylglycine-generating enzyme required for sulfatase activity
MFKVRDAQFNFQCSKFKVGYGEDCEKPVHTVHMQKSFAIGLYQVTFDEYDIYAKVTGRSLPADNGWGRRRRPVINVAREEVAAYCEWFVRTNR